MKLFLVLILFSYCLCWFHIPAFAIIQTCALFCSPPVVCISRVSFPSVPDCLSPHESVTAIPSFVLMNVLEFGLFFDHYILIQLLILILPAFILPRFCINWLFSFRDLSSNSSTFLSEPASTLWPKHGLYRPCSGGSSDSKTKIPSSGRSIGSPPSAIWGSRSETWVSGLWIGLTDEFLQHLGLTSTPTEGAQRYQCGFHFEI